MKSERALAASYIFAASPSIFAAHIQLPDALTSSIAVTLAHTRLVSASAHASRPMAAQSRKPLMGCSPMAVAPPVVPRWLWATTATSERVNCSGPTHCCCAMRPVTDRSTLLVRNRFDPTELSRNTRSSALMTVTSAGNCSGLLMDCFLSLLKTFCGILPSTFSRGRSTGVVPSSASHTRTIPSPVMCPTTLYGAFSRLQRVSNSSTDSGRMRSA
mmetsp:Transcript_30393/g.88336  ORF Transcript_30393/g.88336 Transcript_30393/m.88336 type:complete len:215 (-) Transcript_30393:1503-2147(-)